MTLNQQMITILLVAAAGMLTRYLPFILFPEGKQIPPFVNYLGKVLPSAVFGFLVIYCLRNVTPLSGSHGIPELTAGLITAGTYVWKRNTLLSIAAGTIAYMLLVQLVF